MFRNLLVYRLSSTWEPDFDALSAALDAAPFAPCGATQPVATGWVAPRGQAHGALAESVGGHWLLRLMVEQRMLPGTVVKRRCDELAQAIEAQSGRKPGRKQRKELQEQARLELLPQAFTRQSSMAVWIAPQQRLLMIDAGSAAKADAAITLLTKGIDGFGVEPLHTALAPATAMAGWLLGADDPAGFDLPAVFGIDRDCELKSDDEMKSVVRYARHRLDTDEVRAHIGLGKRPTRLALTWEGRVSFVLTDALLLKKLEFLDGVDQARPEAGSHEGDDFDADAAIATGELIRLIPDLVDALGGEQVPGQAAPSGTVPTPALPAAAHAATTDIPPWEDA